MSLTLEHSPFEESILKGLPVRLVDGQVKLQPLLLMFGEWRVCFDWRKAPRVPLNGQAVMEMKVHLLILGSALFAWVVVCALAMS